MFTVNRGKRPPPGGMCLSLSVLHVVGCSEAVWVGRYRGLQAADGADHGEGGGPRCPSPGRLPPPPGRHDGVSGLRGG